MSYFGSKGFKQWCEEIDGCVIEDIYAMSDIFQRNLDAGDSYAAQMRDMGFCFEKGKVNSARFIDCLQYLQQKSTDGNGVFEPVKIFQRKGMQNSKVLYFGLPSSSASPSDFWRTPSEDSNVLYVANLFTGSGIECFDDPNLEKLNLLKPDVFVLLLSSGRFPIGCPTRELTNQTLSAHDVAHLGGFLIAPDYAKEMLRLFHHVFELTSTAEGQKVQNALENFDSYYSLRIYYLIEVLAKVRNVQLLESVLGKKISEYPLGGAKKEIKTQLLQMTAVERIKYVRKVCDEFHKIIAPLGGESRDILNRQRKQKRAAFTIDTNTKRYSAATSKFYQNSMYSLYYDVKEATHECRSSHPNYLETVCELYATFLAALVGTAQLSLADWVDGSLSPVPAKESKLYKYVDGLFDHDHLFWKAFCAENYDAIAN